MSRDTLVELTRRTLAHALAGTVPQADSVVEIPVANYLDEQRWQREVDRIFRRVPLTLGFSAELAEPGSYQALDAVGVPVLLSRGADGKMRAFINQCSHRGAVVVDEGVGTARRFTCPYHAWSYDQEGALVGILDRADFGEFDTSCRGFDELPCAERAGLIFVTVNPASSIDIDDYLAGYDDVLEHLGLADCHVVGRQRVDGPNWKLAYDGYLDFYHLPILHKKTFGPDFINKAIYDAWGPHQRVSAPDPGMAGLADRSEDRWPDHVLTAGVWTIFPHISIATFDAGGPIYMVSQLFPSAGPGESFTVQHFLATFEPDEAQSETIAAQMEFLRGVVLDEDYYTGNLIQHAASGGAKETFLFGRNEAGGQRFHDWVGKLIEADDETATALFTDAGTDFQP